MRTANRALLLAGLLLMSVILISCTALGAAPVTGNDTFVDFSDKISAERMTGTVEKLTAIPGYRLAGLDGEKAAGDYIARQFKAIGLPVEEQVFPVTSYRCLSTEVKVNAPYEDVIESHSLTFSKSTPVEGVNGEVVYVGMGSQEEMAKVDVKGKIVLMRRGGEFFRIKTERAHSLGAVGAMYFDPNQDKLIRATLLNPANIPAISILKADAERIIKAGEQGDVVRVTLKENSETKPGVSTNLIARLTTANTSDAKTIIIGAHYDGVDSPAANDNASGVAVLLETARVLAQQKPQCNIVFVAFGAEEIGTIGSDYYVATLKSSDIKKTLGMINLDMVGRGDTLNVFTAEKDAKSMPADLAVSCMNKFGYTNKRGDSYGSDHVAFEMAGIPVAYFEYSPDPDYHTPQDSVDKIVKEDLVRVCNVVTSITDKIAKNP